MSPHRKHTWKLGLWVAGTALIGVFFAYFLTTIGYGPILKLGNSAKEIAANTLAGTSETEEKPAYFYTTEGEVTKPKVLAEAYLVGDLNTGDVILAKNQDAKFPIASTTKLMTALVAGEITDISGVAEVSREAVSTEGQNGELRVGEKIKTTDLIYPLLLESSNDAAEVLAEHFGRESFISKMNQIAQGLNMSSTSYEDPSGLSPNNQSTVSDMFRLAGYIRTNKPSLFDITTKRSAQAPKHNWSNISQFLGKDGYAGGKSGYTDPARQTLISLFNLPLGETGTRPIAITLLRSPDRARDVESIVRYLKKNVYYGGAADATRDWVTAKIDLPDIKDPSFVTLAFVGDIMLDRGVRSSVVRNFNNDYSALFEKLGVLKKTDIVFGNLEGPASNQGVDARNLYSFRMDPAVIPALAGAGFKVLSVANNHVADWGRLAYEDTLARLKENEIKYTGGGTTSTEAELPVIIEKYGMKIGFLGFSDVGPQGMEAGIETSGVLLASNPRFDEIVRNAAGQVDYLVVSFHFGDEYKTVHNARQAELAHRAIDNGAKFVIGSHPHVIQDTEIYKGGYIAYSLGNFIFDQAFSTNTMQGMLLNVKISDTGQITVRKDIVKLNSAFQPSQIIPGKEEKLTTTPLPVSN